MKSNFGPEDVLRKIEEKNEKDLTKKKEELDRQLEKQNREEAEKAAKQASDETLKLERKKKEDYRANERGRFLNLLLDWELEDLEEEIAEGRNNPVVSDDKITLKFEFSKSSFFLTEHRFKTAVEWLHKRLSKQWTKVETRDLYITREGEYRDWDEHVGVEFTLTKPTQPGKSETA